ncbi:MAG: OmpA family protein [Cryomorphaceae bacterium]|nr:OmpA family protein [Cryomorphaceae bacterium]
MKKLAFTLFIIPVSLIWAQQKSIETTVFFNSDSHEITKQAEEELLAAIKSVPEGETFQIELSGHTDSEGDDLYNLNLSKRRVKSVAAYLKNFGIAEHDIKEQYLGERKPVATNSDEKNRQQNRRVELRITYTYFENTRELNDFLLQKYRVSTSFSNEQGITITCPKGSRVTVPNAAFVDQNGMPIEGDINMQVTEAIDYGSMMINGLSTQSGENILETGGMIKLEATDLNGEEVYLQKDIQISVPTDFADDGMTVFTSTTGEDWEDTEQPVQSDFAFEFDEVYPILRSSYINIPKFVYDGPQPPSVPTKLRKPIEPKKPAYIQPQIRWFTLNKVALRQRADDENEKAMRKYEKNYDRYQLRLAEFDQSEITFPKRLRQFEKDYEFYKKQRREDSIAYFSSEEVLRIVENNKTMKERAILIFEEEVDAYRQRRKEAYMAHVAKYEALGVDVTEQFAANFVMNVSMLGWINIDKFYNVSEEDMMFVEVNSGAEDARVQLIFTDINSIMRCYSNQAGKVLSPKFPKNERAEIFSYKVKDGKIWAAKQPVDQSKVYRLQYQQISLEALSEMLDGA